MAQNTEVLNGGFPAYTIALQCARLELATSCHSCGAWLARATNSFCPRQNHDDVFLDQRINLFGPLPEESLHFRPIKDIFLEQQADLHEQVNGIHQLLESSGLPLGR